MIVPAEPMIAPEVQRVLLEVTGVELFVSNGFDSVAGFPLPNGQLPVGTRHLGMVLVHPDEWQDYRDLCAFHQDLKEAHSLAA